MTVRANTQRSKEARTAHVPAAASHARADEWDDEAAAVIAAELAACTLGHRERPELLMTPSVYSRTQRHELAV